MDERLDRAVKAALAEMDRQEIYQFHSDEAGNVNPTHLGVDTSRMNFVAVIEAALKAADQVTVWGGPINEPPKRIQGLENEKGATG